MPRVMEIDTKNRRSNPTKFIDSNLLVPPHRLPFPSRSALSGAFQKGRRSAAGLSELCKRARIELA